MKLLRLTLFIAWVLLIVAAFLIVEFPSAAWNHAVSEAVWVISIGLVFATLGFCVLVLIRLVSRVSKRKPRHESKQEPAPMIDSERKGLRGWAIWLTGAIAAALITSVLVVVIEHEIKASVVYQLSVAQARGSAKVAEALGKPIVVGWLVLGQLTESSDGRGRAELTIPLKGPKGVGTLRVGAGRRAGQWQLSTLRFVPSDYTSSADLLAK